MEDKREWKDYSSAEKLIAIDAYLSGMTKLDDSDETANGERLQWIREHLPAYDLSGGKNYIFISYSHRDYKQVFSDLAYFSYNSQTRVRFWYDEGLPVGEDWEKAAGGFMADPHCVGVVFYLSKNLLLSPSVFKEIQTVKSLKSPTARSRSTQGSTRRQRSSTTLSAESSGRSPQDRTSSKSSSPTPTHLSSTAGTTPRRA